MVIIPSIASDHVDGPVTSKDAVGEISDFYAFPSPQDSNKLTLIINTYPLVLPNGHFSKKVQVSTVIKKAVVDLDSRLIKTEGSEFKITCSFNDAHSKPHKVSCVSNTGLKASAEVDRVGHSGDFAVYAGKRSDSFFFNAGWATDFTTKNKVPKPTKNSNSVEHLNTQSIVIEIEKEKIFNDSTSLFAATATTSTYGRQLDFFGRPEVTNIFVTTRKGQTELRDSYNQEKPFAMSAANKKKYAQRVADNVRYFDSLDGQQDWSNAELTHFTELLLNDYTVVDLSKDCSGDTFYSIEKAVTEGLEHTNCGGRQLSDDIMDTLFTVGVNNFKGDEVTDGVKGPFKQTTRYFPYLAKPSTGPKAWLFAALASFFKPGQ